MIKITGFLPQAPVAERQARSRLMECAASPRYYFHLHEGQDVIHDSEGLELPNAEAAQMRALTETKGLLAVELCQKAVVDLTRTI